VKRGRFHHVLFLDVKMPRRTVFDVLRWMRENPKFAVVPTIMFSTLGR
jgi:CheY-like chemotaxis protein